MEIAQIPKKQWIDDHPQGWVPNTSTMANMMTMA